jgi:hypothetical protein
LLGHFGSRLEPERDLLLGSNARDVLLLLGDRIEDAASVVSQNRDDGYDERDEESAAGHEASQNEEVKLYTFGPPPDGDWPHSSLNSAVGRSVGQSVDFGESDLYKPHITFPALSRSSSSE